MGKAARIGLIILLALVLLAGGVVLLAETAWVRGIVENRLSKRLDGREVRLGELSIDWGFPLGIELKDVHIANAEWADNPTFFAAERLSLSLGVSELARGQVDLARLEIEQPVVDLVRREDGSSNWSALKSDEPDDESSSFDPQVLLLHGGQIRYEDRKLGAELDIRVTSAGAQDPRAQEIRVTGTGQLKDKPVQFSATAGPPGGDAPAPVRLQGGVGQIRLGFEGTARELATLDGLQGQIRVEAPESAELNAGRLEVPAFTLSAQLTRDGERLALDDIALASPQSHLRGAMRYEGGDVPRVDVQLQADRLDLNRWGVMALFSGDRQAAPAPEPGREPVNWQAGLNGLLEPLRRYRAAVDVSIGRLDYADARLDELVIKGHLDDRTLQITRLHARQGEGGVEAAVLLQLGGERLTGKLDADIDQLHLGQVLGPFGLDQLGQLDGDLHASLQHDSLHIADTRLAYHSPAQALDANVSLRTHGHAGMQLQGSGMRERLPFRFDLSLGAPLDLFSDRPYPIQGELMAGETELQLDGSITRPLDPAAAAFKFHLKGPDPARLEPLLGVSLPPLPPYQAGGELTWEPPMLRAQGLKMRFGQSDVQGGMRLRLQGKPMLWATLRSDQLRLADARPLKEVTTEPEPEGRRVFSRDPWDLEALNKLDAKVDYQAAKLDAKDIPFQEVKLELTLEHGVLTARPLSVGLGGGKVDGQLQLDARRPPAEAQLELSLRRVDLKSLLRKADLPNIAADTAGVLGGEVKLRGSGGSMNQLMASLAGEAKLALSQGRLDMLVVELLGLDAGEALVGYLAKSDEVPMQCGYTHLVAEQGTVAVQQLFIATSDSNITGEGNVDLDREVYDLQVEAHPKDFSVLSASSPIKIQGGLADPKVSVLTRELLARGLATVVGAVLAPPLAILPWVEAGTGEDEGMGCSAALRAFERGTRQR